MPNADKLLFLLIVIIGVFIYIFLAQHLTLKPTEDKQERVSRFEQKCELVGFTKQQCHFMRQGADYEDKGENE